MSDLMRGHVVSVSAAVIALVASPALACPDENSAKFPYFGQITLNGSYNPDPFRMTVLAGGVSALGDCGLEAEGLVGYEGDGVIDVRPDVVLQWEGGAQRLAFTVENEADTLLVIQDPAGGWHFDDNGHEQNPLVVFEDPEAGAYVVYIGAHGTPPVNNNPGDLIITETGP